MWLLDQMASPVTWIERRCRVLCYIIALMEGKGRDVQVSKKAGPRLKMAPIQRKTIRSALILIDLSNRHDLPSRKSTLS